MAVTPMLSASVALGATGCAREPANVAVAPEPAEIIVEPAELRLSAGSEAALSAQVNDPAGQPIGGASIRFATGDAEALAVSDRGVVTSRGPAARSTVVVASGRVEKRVPVEVTAGPPERIEKLEGDAQRVMAGERVERPLTVRLSDAFGNRLANVALVFEPEDEGQPAGEAATDGTGQAGFHPPALTQSGTVRWLVRPNDATAPAEAFTVEILPGPPAAAELVCAAPVTGTAGYDLGLTVRDSHGNPVPETSLAAKVEPGGGQPAAAATDARGFARLTGTLPSKARSAAVVLLAGEREILRQRLSSLPAQLGRCGTAGAEPPATAPGA